MIIMCMYRMSLLHCRQIRRTFLSYYHVKLDLRQEQLKEIQVIVSCIRNYVAIMWQ